MSSTVTIAGVLACFVLTACADDDSRTRLQALSKQVDECRMKQQVSHDQIEALRNEVQSLRASMDAMGSKSIPAFLSPADTGYSYSVTADGLLIPISVESVDSFPGGARYHLGVTN